MHWLWINGHFLGIDWHFWKIVGWIGNAAFFSRFFVQWCASERQKKVVIPTSFWYLSLAGSLLLLIYAAIQRDSVFIFAYAFTWIPYIRNLILHRRHQQIEPKTCPDCREPVGDAAHYCAHCGLKLS